jgi:DNA (cytosine-5)-methyltransferase 1
VGTAGPSDYLAELGAAWNAHLAERRRDAPTVLSLFAGCGGSSLGYSMAGYREVLAVEWNAEAAATFRRTFPAVPLYEGDITALAVDDALARANLAPGALDVLDGSPPCQGFSTSGKRLLHDPRNGLFREYVRLLDGLRPRAFVMENVGGLVLGKMRLVFVEILRALRACGYRVTARRMNVMYFGVPQSRERMIFVGVRDDLAVVPSVPRAQSYPPTVRQALAGVALDEGERAWLLAAGQKYAAYAHWARIPVGRRLCDVPGFTAGFNARKYHPDRPAPTIVRNDGNLTMHGALHWAEQRRFTVAEFKRLASFPDQFKFAGDWGAAVHQIGNAVPPLFMRAIAVHLRALLGSGAGDH